MGKTRAELKEAAKDVAYEINMLLFAASWIEGWHTSPLSQPGGEHKNMALESFLLHYRNLRAFLCPTLQGQNIRPDDITGADFLGRPHAEDVGGPEVFRDDKQRLDKMLAHLSYSRPSFVQAGNADWNVSQMCLTMLKELDRFFAPLSHDPEMRSWFPPFDELNRHRSSAAVRAALPLRNS